MNVLIIGGAGYIGSHTANLISKTNDHIVILDDLSTGHKWAIPEGAKFYEGSFGNTEILDQIFTENKIDVILHFAAFIEVEESTQNPLKYYKNNTMNALNLLEACSRHNIKKFIFSSTAAVYGEPNSVPISEDALLSPINPYGNSKFCTELILRDFAKSQVHIPLNDRFRYIALRYFNVAGASRDGHLGQVSKNATHLIKIASEAAVGKRSGMKIFGSDYPTPDGTCLRDYIHVDDLAKAHLDALEYLNQGGESDVFNCGYGHGYSVKEVIDMIKKVSSSDFPVENSQRRAGDPAELTADSSKIKRVLKWTPEYDNLEYICSSAYKWEKSLL